MPPRCGPERLPHTTRLRAHRFLALPHHTTVVGYSGLRHTYSPPHVGAHIPPGLHLPAFVCYVCRCLPRLDTTDFFLHFLPLPAFVLPTARTRYTTPLFSHLLDDAWVCVHHTDLFRLPPPLYRLVCSPHTNTTRWFALLPYGFNAVLLHTATRLLRTTPLRFRSPVFVCRTLYGSCGHGLRLPHTYRTTVWTFYLAALPPAVAGFNAHVPAARFPSYSRTGLHVAPRACRCLTRLVALTTTSRCYLRLFTTAANAVAATGRYRGRSPPVYYTTRLVRATQFPNTVQVYHSLAVFAHTASVSAVLVRIQFIKTFPHHRGSFIRYGVCVCYTFFVCVHFAVTVAVYVVHRHGSIRACLPTVAAYRRTVAVGSTRLFLHMDVYAEHCVVPTRAHHRLLPYYLYSLYPTPPACYRCYRVPGRLRGFERANHFARSLRADGCHRILPSRWHLVTSDTPLRALAVRTGFRARLPFTFPPSVPPAADHARWTARSATRLPHN